MCLRNHSFLYLQICYLYVKLYLKMTMDYKLSLPVLHSTVFIVCKFCILLFLSCFKFLFSIELLFAQFVWFCIKFCKSFDLFMNPQKGIVLITLQFIGIKIHLIPLYILVLITCNMSWNIFLWCLYWWHEFFILLNIMSS